MRIISFTLLTIITCSLTAFSQEIPQWFTDNLTEHIGTWRADNSKYQSENEPFDAYEIVWEWGIGKKSIVGHMYGITGNSASDNFWEFRQYWDFEKHEGIVQQFGGGGAVGIGPIEYINSDSSRLSQIFHGPRGSTFVIGHININKPGKQIVQSFFITEDDEWKPNREYEFIKMK